MSDWDIGEWKSAVWLDVMEDLAFPRPIAGTSDNDGKPLLSHLPDQTGIVKRKVGEIRSIDVSDSRLK